MSLSSRDPDRGVSLSITALPDLEEAVGHSMTPLLEMPWEVNPWLKNEFDPKALLVVSLILNDGNSSLLRLAAASYCSNFSTNQNTRVDSNQLVRKELWHRHWTNEPDEKFRTDTWIYNSTHITLVCFIVKNKLTLVFSRVCPFIDNEFRHNIDRVVCGCTRLSPCWSTGTSTMLWRFSWSITGHTPLIVRQFNRRHQNLKSIISDKFPTLYCFYNQTSEKARNSLFVT